MLRFLRHLNIYIQTIEPVVHAQLYSGGTGFETLSEPRQSLLIFLSGLVKSQQPNVGQHSPRKLSST
jgi:hypothetical protein